MSQKQAMQRRPLTANGSSHRRTDKDLGYRSDKLLQSAKSGSGISGNTGVSHGVCNHLNSENIIPTDNNGLLWERPVSGNRGGGLERILHNRLLFITMFLIGQPVDVQVKNGSIYTGIFHTANVGKDYGIVLKMARLTKDGSVKGQTNEGNKDVGRKAPMKTLIIFAKDLVQVIAKDIPLSGDGMGNGRAHENRHDIVTDSFLSQGHHSEVERELKPWTPDKDAPESLHLENTFQNTWNRNWDQFETNKSLFGVESTFDEELYTTKLERGPQMRDLEKKASIIAREIEEQATGNFHLAEERGIHLSKELESLDEESRFSSVLRGEDISEDNEDRYIDNHNEETFGIACTEDAPSISNDSKGSASISDESDNKPSQAFQASSAGSLGAGESPYQSLVSRGSPLVLSSASDLATIQSFGLDSSFSQVNNICRDLNEMNLHENANSSMQKPDDQADHHRSFAEGILDKTMELGFCSSDASSASSRGKMPPVEAESDSVQKLEWSGVATSGANTMPVSKTDACPLSSARHIPTGSSTGSASLKKSTLNPNAKEFKFNPSAKSYNPCFAAPRPTSSGIQAPVYMAGSIPPLTPMQGVPLGLGVSSLMQQPSQQAKIGQFNNAIAAAGVSAAPYLQTVPTVVPRVSGTPVHPALPAQSAIKIPSPGQQIVGHAASGQQPIRYTSQVAPLHQPPAYLLPNTQMCSQQTVFGQPGQVVYIQSYPHEMMQGLPFNPPQGSIPAQAASQQAQQPKHRGTTVHGMQFCVAAPFISGQQPYVHSAPISHLPNTLQPSPGVLASTSLSGIQIPQGIVAGIGPAVQNGTGLAVGNGMWVGGKGATTNFQQQ